METEKYQCKEAEEIRAKNNSAREQSSMHFAKQLFLKYLKYQFL